MSSRAAYLVTLLLVASCSGMPDKSEQTIDIRLSSSLNACFIADVEVPCGEVGAKLISMNVPLSSHIHCVGDTVVSYELVHSLLESLDKAGYSTKVGFLTD
jgi:hypothetical protein